MLGFALGGGGKYSLDAETGQVGPEIAELLGIAQITLSQHPRDFLEAGQVVLSNAGTTFFLGMQRTAVEKLNLPEELERVLIESIPGQGVMRIGNEYAPISVWNNPVYQAIFTTDPAERKALRQKEQAHKREHQTLAIPSQQKRRLHHDSPSLPASMP